jgi:hypothetical protein
MAINLYSGTWSPSELQQNVALNSYQPGNSALQRIANQQNQSWIDTKNYLFAFPRTERLGSAPAVTLNGGLIRTIFGFRAHNPVGLESLRLIVRGFYTGGTGANVRIRDNGTTIATINLAAAVSTQTILGLVLGLGDRTYTIEVQTQSGSVATMSGLWVSWGDFTP